MDSFKIKDQPHRRYNPLEKEWILCSPHRLKRPWQGKTEKTEPDVRVKYDPGCYLCPGNERAGGKRNPAYIETYVFDNDFMAILPDGSEGEMDVEGRGLLIARSERGLCRVICFSPRHDLTLPEMGLDAVTKVVEVWAEQYQELGSRPEINHVSIFENKGQLMGCSNPHPHCQIWAQASIPSRVSREIGACSEYREKHDNACLLCDVVELEARLEERLVAENDRFIAFVPFWAIWPFEIMVAAKWHVGHLGEMSGTERRALAGILREVTIRYDNLFSTSFPYSMGMHQTPTDGNAHPEFHFHIHFYPPLLRSATNRKFVVGYELTSEPQRDITPELAARRLLEQAITHYRHQE